MLRPYEVDNEYGTFYVLAETPSRAKTMVYEDGWWGTRQDGGKYKDYRARLLKGDHRMEEDQVYIMRCETCNMPCNEQRDPQDRPLGDPGRTETAVCEFCDPQRR